MKEGSTRGSLRTRGSLLLLLLAMARSTPAQDALPALPVDDPLIADVATVDEHEWVQAVGRRRQRVSSAPQAVTVLDERDLVSTPAVTLPDRLRYVAGIDVYQTRHGQYDVGLRGYNGLNNNRVLAVVDGREFRWEMLGTVMWMGVLHPSDISRVEILKGPGSVTYGANAFGGVIAIADREPDDRHRVRVVANRSSTDATEGDITALGPLSERFYYKVSAGATDLRDLDGPDSGLTYTPNPRTGDTGDHDLLTRRWSGTLGWRIGPDLRAEAEYHGVRIVDWELVDDLDVGSNATAWWLHTASVRLAGDWGELRHIRQWMDYSYSNQKASYGPPFPDFGYAQAGFSDVVDTTRAQVNLLPGDHALSLGGEVTRLVSSSNLWAVGGDADDESTWDEAVSTNRALFAEDQYAFAPAWTATAGVRWDRHSRAGDNVSPRLAMNWAPSGDEFWLLSLSSGYRLPTTLEASIQEYYFASDPDLEAETVRAAELGWQRRTWLDQVTIGANGFYSRSNDQIWILPLSGDEMQANYDAWLATGPDLTVQPGPYFQFRNLDDPADVYGAELSLSVRIPDSPITLWTNGTWQRLRYRHGIVYRSSGYDSNGDGSRDAFVIDTTLPSDINAPPEWKANLGVTVDQGPLFAGVVLRWVDSRTLFSFAASDFAAGQLAVQEIPAYLTLDTNIGYDFGHGERERFIRLSVLDLADAVHHEHYQATEAELGAARERQLTSDLGLTATLQVGWAF